MGWERTFLKTLLFETSRTVKDSRRVLGSRYVLLSYSQPELQFTLSILCRHEGISAFLSQLSWPLNSGAGYH